VHRAKSSKQASKERKETLMPRMQVKRKSFTDSKSPPRKSAANGRRVLQGGEQARASRWEEGEAHTPKGGGGRCLSLHIATSPPSPLERGRETDRYSCYDAEPQGDSPSGYVSLLIIAHPHTLRQRDDPLRVTSRRL